MFHRSGFVVRCKMLLTTLGPGCTKFNPNAVALMFSSLRSPEILDGRVKTLHPKVGGVVRYFLRNSKLLLTSVMQSGGLRFMVACLQLVVMLAMRRSIFVVAFRWGEIWRYVVLEAEMEKHGIRKIDLVVWGPEHSGFCEKAACCLVKIW